MPRKRKFSLKPFLSFDRSTNSFSFMEQLIYNAFLDLIFLISFQLCLNLRNKNRPYSSSKYVDVIKELAGHKRWTITSMCGKNSKLFFFHIQISKCFCQNLKYSLTYFLIQNVRTPSRDTWDRVRDYQSFIKI